MYHVKSDKDMKKVIIYLLTILFVIGCKIHKSTQNIPERYSNIDQKLADLSNYIELQWDNTYNFRHDRIRLPTDYATRTWTNEIGNFWSGDKIDTISIKYLIFEEMLIDIVNSADTMIYYNQIINNFGKPSNINLFYDSKRYNNLGYYFNTLNNPNCACRTSKNHYLGSNCSILEFQFDELGQLNKVNALMFGP